LSNNQNNNNFVIGLAIGLSLGFISGILMAPKSGKDTRAILMDTGREWKDKAEELTSSTKERLSNAAKVGKKTVVNLRDEDFDNLDLDDENL
jgi:gas vesicle protein|tara:strand:- start:389 stop:664 length:276 start_codon:yes stop_codon:yes gene_type:complete